MQLSQKFGKSSKEQQRDLGNFGLLRRGLLQ